MSNVANQIPDVEPRGKREPILDKALEEGEGPTLEQQKFSLEQKKVLDRLKQAEREFSPILYAKIAAICIALLYVLVLGGSLVTFIWYGDRKIHDWHVLIALISGGYLSVFAVLAILIKGLFSKEKDETPPVTLAEAMKAAAEIFKSVKGK